MSVSRGRWQCPKCGASKRFTAHSSDALHLMVIATDEAHRKNTTCTGTSMADTPGNIRDSDSGMR